jgi:outer membrane receptor protein involved in Fe transport
MLRNITFLVVSFLLSGTFALAQVGLGTLKGSVIDGDSKQPIPFCKVLIKQNGSIKGGANTDFDGKFQINSIGPGSYDVEIRNETEGYQPTAIEGVIVSAEKITFLDGTAIFKAKDVQEIEEMKVVAYRVPLIDKDGGASGATVTREDIARLPVRSAAGVAATVGGVNADEGGGGISVRGARSDGTFFYIDGIKVRGSSNLPKSAIEEVSVITGGLPANYGDATGGIISITTRGPSSTYFGSFEAVSSGFYFSGQDPNGYDGKVIGLDKFGYNLLEGMFSGPLWMEKDSTGKKVKPRLGFLLSANYTNQLDSRPASGGTYRVKKEVRDALIANPLRTRASGGTNHNADFLRLDDFEKTPFRMNAQSSVLSTQLKVDVNTGPSVNLTFGGSANYNKRKAWGLGNSLLNFTNNGDAVNFDWRAFGRLTQRFSNDSDAASRIGSAYYTINVDYSKEYSQSYDANHKYDIFSYGHVGTFTTRRSPSYSFDPETNRYIHDGFRDEEVSFAPSETNKALAAITTQYYSLFEGNPVGNYENLFQIQQGNALRNGDAPNSVYGLWSNIGAPSNGFGKSETDQFRFTGSGSANIGDHSVTLGFEFEQRWDRGFSNGDNGPLSIWNTSRQYLNNHIRELDKSQSSVDDNGSFKRVTYQRLNTSYAYESGTGEYGGQGGKVDANGNPIQDDQYFFDYNVRELIFGAGSGGNNEFIDIDQYDPSKFHLGMFSADELLNSGRSFVSYYGYDHTGTKVKGRTDVNKYFSEFDENGNYKRFVGAFQPIYGAAYLMDKFSFNDLVFNVGVRIDYFNANQPVLKDPYLLREARTVREANALAATDPTTYSWVDIPESMGDDYTVYVNDVNTPSQIKGFRQGDVFFDNNGVEVTESSDIRGPSGIAPWLINSEDATKPSPGAFESYKPQFNVMPRIAFSFPVSDEASFFAHYDVLTKRPTQGARFNPYEYQFLALRTETINNPNLKPEKTIDYEIGFQQVLSKTSSLKFSAFYREQRDQVQLQTIFDAYPNTYNTYANRDFGTVKGMTIAYDLRRTGNVRITANYTLQFADGTGSSATSAIGLINAGVPNLRFLAPFSFDQRHAFAVTMDYRYGDGKDYNGPLINDFKVFENTGLNVFTRINSGSPYTRQSFITNSVVTNGQSAGQEGTTNGSRLPWAYQLDLQLDRTFNVELKRGEDKTKTTFLNVYVRVTNLLNQFNILGVYRATGNSDDDGYLAAAASQSAIQNQLDEQSFRDYYLMRVQNPFNISIPRQIRLGVKFDF